MLTKLRDLLKDFIVPVLVAILPFGQSVIDFFTEPEHQFVYQREYTKNPIDEWNRYVAKFVEHLDPADLAESAPHLHYFAR